MATKRKLKADGATGKVAIYTVDDTAINDAPFTAPLSNISRVEFHSDLDYLAVASVQTGTLSLPSVSPQYPFTTRHNLFAHGLAYQPLVLGELTNYGGRDVSLLGTTLIYSVVDVFSSHPAVEGWFRSVQLGADATHVYLHEYCLGPSASRTLPALTLNWRVLVTTRNMDATTGNDNAASHPSNLYISPSRVVFGRGKFDTDRRHIKKDASGFPVYIGRSIDFWQSGVIISMTQYVNGYNSGNTGLASPVMTPVYTVQFTAMDAV